jgi:hypothetical protein
MPNVAGWLPALVARRPIFITQHVGPIPYRRATHNTDQLSSRLRLPLWLGLGNDVPDAIAAESDAL